MKTPSILSYRTSGTKTSALSPPHSKKTATVLFTGQINAEEPLEVLTPKEINRRKWRDFRLSIQARISMGMDFANHRGVGPVKRAMWWLIKKESHWMNSMGYKSTLFTGNLYWFMNAMETGFWMFFGSPALLKATEHLNLNPESERHIYTEHFEDRPLKPLSKLDKFFLNTVFRWRKPFNHTQALWDIGVALNIIG